MASRKIIHVDMDAFYASVEQRDDPQLRGKPVVVAWRGNRSVVCAASYEARMFGVRSAMPAVRAERLCPNAIFLPPDFPRYRAVSRQVREIFKRHTDLIEPLSLDEAYLDVSENKTGLPTATQVARTIREQIRLPSGNRRRPAHRDHGYLPHPGSLPPAQGSGPGPRSTDGDPGESNGDANLLPQHAERRRCPPARAWRRFPLRIRQTAARRPRHAVPPPASRRRRCQRDLLGPMALSLRPAG